MVGPTLKSEGDRVDNDNLKKVGVLGAYNLSIIEWTRELVTDSAHAGETLMPPTGAGGEDKRQLAGDKDPRADSFMEWDPAQAAGVSTDQTAADEIIIIPFHMNTGAVCRNIQFADSAANVNAMTPACTSSGTAGSLKVVTEMSFEAGSDTGGYQYQVNTWGTNAAAGTYGLDFKRTVAMQMYYLANPSAAYTEVVYIL